MRANPYTNYPVVLLNSWDYLGHRAHTGGSSRFIYSTRIFRISNREQRRGYDDARTVSRGKKRVFSRDVTRRPRRGCDGPDFALRSLSSSRTSASKRAPRVPATMMVRRPHFLTLLQLLLAGAMISLPWPHICLKITSRLTRVSSPSRPRLASSHITR